MFLAEGNGDELEVEVHENGDEYYTDDSQERFNMYYAEADSIMRRVSLYKGDKHEN